MGNLLSAASAVRQQTAGGAFDPETSITWHSLFWAEGTDFVAQGYSDAGAVGTWPNETSEVDATQSNEPKKPLYEASVTALNNQPAVTFDGTADTLGTGVFTGGAISQPVTIVVVGENHDAGTERRYVYDGGTVNEKRMLLAKGQVSDYWSIWAGTWVDSTTAAAAAAFGSVALYKATPATLTVDGTAIASGDEGDFPLDGIQIGASFATTVDFWDGSIAFLGIYEGDITSDGNWSAFQSWVSTHYGVSI